VVEGIDRRSIMSIITISRGSYSRGKEVAEIVAKELNYKCISRDILLEASNQFNIPEIRMIRALNDTTSVFERFDNGQDRYISYFKSTFLSHMIEGNVVYHGLAGHFFLQNISHVLKVRINAKMSARVIEEMKRENCSEETALYNLKKDDGERRKWGLKLYGKDTWDSRLYDIVFCVDSLTVEDIAEMIVNAVRKKQFRETPASLAELRKKAFLTNMSLTRASAVPLRN
jgi:cytidylate kinase